ncbi:hypothetical protein Tco_0308102 [Tanacetum coccineum]
MRYSTLCRVKGVEAWDAECNLVQHNSHMPIVLFEKLANAKGVWDEGVGTWEIIKIGKASRLKSKNKDSKEQNPPPPPPTPTQEEPNLPDSPLLPLPNKPLQLLSPIEEAKTIESMAIKLEMKKEIEEEEVAKIIEEGLPKNMDDPENYIVPLKVLGLGKACPSNDKLLMADNTIARAYGTVRNVRLQIGFHAYLYNGKGIMTIDDGVINHVYHVKKRNKVVVEEHPEDDDDWLDVFEVGHDEKGYPIYGPTLPSHL